MSRQFLTAIDLAKNELQNARIQNLASAPGSPVFGLIYYNTTDNVLYWYNGTVWVAASGGSVAYGAVVPETTFALAPANGVATTLSRSDHTHGSPTHDSAAHALIPISGLAPATGPISMGGNVINNVGTPVAPTDAANKGYVDNAIAGLSWKDSVQVGSTTNVNLASMPTVMDGVTMTNGMRILIKNQSQLSQNGIYIFNGGAAAATRATDADTDQEIFGAAVFVEEGTTLRDTGWVVTTERPIAIGSDPIAWAQFAGGGTIQAGAGLVLTGNIMQLGTDTTLTTFADYVTRAALTGDVTAPEASNATTIAANAVTNAKLAKVPTQTFKGNNTIGTADPVDLTMSQAKAMLNYVATDIIGVARAVSANCGAGTSTVVYHDFNTRNVLVQVYRNSAPYDTVEVDVERTDLVSVTVRFAVAPTAGQFRIVVTG